MRALARTIALIAMTLPAVSHAQNAPADPTAGDRMAIAAVVNEDVITYYDLQSRVGLFLATSGIEATPEMKRRLLPQVVHALIDERLKIQEAKQNKLSVTDQEIREAVSNVEANNGMEAGAFRKMLTSKGVDMGTLYSQIEGEIAWAKVVRGNYVRDVIVTPTEVNNVLAKLKANQGKPEMQVSEIVLPVANGVRDADVRQVADRLVQQARSGTAFAALAQQFSQSPTAALGGDLGWIMKGDLEDEVEAVMARMEPKEISDPIRTASGYHIIQLNGRRNSGAAEPMMAAVTLVQIYLPTIGGRAPTPARLAQLSDAISTQISNCQQMEKWAKEIGGPGSGPIPELPIGALPDPVRDAVLKLPVGRISPPIAMPGARVFAMLCSRHDDTGLPSDEQVMAKLQQDKLENIAKQKLRDLRREALIDIRL
jgi:peptidyl-prolyl cis-trans isomerase SurA